jgi:hypothetical protein
MGGSENSVQLAYILNTVIKMALGRCKDCERQLSTDAFRCHHCGAEGYPAKSDESAFGPALFIGAVLLIFLAAAGGDRASSPAAAVQAPPPAQQQCDWRWERRLVGRTFSHQECGAPYFDGFRMHRPCRDVYLDHWQNVRVPAC